MYYDLSNESNPSDPTSSASLSLGPIYLSGQQIFIGIIVEIFALIPSLLLVQIFRRLRPRQKSVSPLREALCQIRSSMKMFVQISHRIILLKFSFF